MSQHPGWVTLTRAGSCRVGQPIGVDTSRDHGLWAMVVATELTVLEGGGPTETGACCGLHTSSLRFNILTLASPLTHAACGSLIASRLRIEFSTPRACSSCEPGIWGVRCARFGLLIPSSNHDVL